MAAALYRGNPRALPKLATRAASNIQVTPARITAAYAMIGLAALYVSDVVFVQVFKDPFLSRVQALKGFVEVGVTGALIFGLTKQSHHQHREKSQQLETQREELALLHRVLRHNLRNDLNVVSGFANLLAKCTSGEPMNTYCEQVRSTAAKIENYTEKAHRIRQASEQATHLETMDLAQDITPTLNQFSTQDVEITVDVPETCIVEAHPMLPSAIREAIANAATHTDADQPVIELTASPATRPGFIQIEVSDNGPGIPAIELEPLRRGEETPLAHTSKLGLWFMKWVVEHSDGDIEFDTSETGTTVRILIPEGVEVDVPTPTELMDAFAAGAS